jgi:DNA polymerase-3 subunit beta
MVRTHDSTIYARLGEGRFPRYQKAFTSEPAHRFSVEAGPLADAVNQALVSVAGETLGVHWVFGPGRLTLWSRSADVGRSEASVAVDYAGDPVEIVLGGRYASEMLGVCGDVPVAVEFTDESRAVMFRLDDGYVHALYPVNSGVAAQKEAVGTPAKVKKMSEKVARAMAAS